MRAQRVARIFDVAFKTLGKAFRAQRDTTMIAILHTISVRRKFKASARSAERKVDSAVHFTGKWKLLRALRAEHAQRAELARQRQRFTDTNGQLAAAPAPAPRGLLTTGARERRSVLRDELRKEDPDLRALRGAEDRRLAQRFGLRRPLSRVALS